MDFASSTNFFDTSRLKSYVRHIKRKIRSKIPDSFVRFIKFKGFISDKERLSKRATAELYDFLFTDTTLDFTPVGPPKVSVVIILYNKAELTYLCLKSLLACSTASLPLEVIIIDNNSTDLTPQLMRRLSGVKYIHNAENVGFLKACNQAIEHMSSPYLLLLNNDTEIHCNSIQIAVQRLEENPSIGAVGARIILPSNKLQEAGSIIYTNGTTKGYLRGSAPDNYAAMFPRLVDYCSGAFLLTRTALFKSLNGFDLRYAPAYYEETDYCVSIQKLGYSILYEPRVEIRHFEFGSAGISSRAMEMMNTNRIKFLEKHEDFLKSQHPEGSPDIICRSKSKKRRILYIDDSVPHPELGAGFPRSRGIINKLCEMGNEVTLFPTIFPEGSWHHIYSHLHKSIEVVKDAGAFGLAEFLVGRKDYYDVVWVSRPHNMQFFIDRVLRHVSRHKTKIIYDAEALFSARYREEARVLNKNSARSDKIFKREMALAKTADAVVCVSESEAEIFKDNGQPNIFIIGHDHSWKPGPNTFENRNGIVILGSLHASNTPNYDGLKWFLDEVLPPLKSRLGVDVPVHVAGNAPLIYTPKFSWLRERLHFTGRFDDLDTLLNQYRIGIIPTRIAAGIPQKGYDLASRGVPAVCTKIIASQMGWRHQEEALVADWTEPEAFASFCADLYKNERLWNQLRTGLEKQCVTAKNRDNTDKVLSRIIETNGERC